MYQRGFRGSPLTRGTCITKCVSGKFLLGFGQGQKSVALHYVDKGNLDAFQVMVVENENSLQIKSQAEICEL